MPLSELADEDPPPPFPDFLLPFPPPTSLLPVLAWAVTVAKGIVRSRNDVGGVTMLAMVFVMAMAIIAASNSTAGDDGHDTEGGVVTVVVKMAVWRG